jgi:hypothetical protein
MQTKPRHFAIRVSLVALLGLGLGMFQPGARAADSVRQREPDGKLKAPRSGKITEISKEKVLLQLTPAATIVDIPANTIDSISYDSQRQQLQERQRADPQAERGRAADPRHEGRAGLL